MAQNPAKRKLSTDGSDGVTLVGETDVDQDEFSFVWTVRHFSVVSQLGSCFKSPIFHGGSNFNHAWQMQIRPKEEVEEVEYLSLRLFLVDCGEGLHCHSNAKVVKANYQFAILDANGQPIYKRGQAPGATATVLEFKLQPLYGWGYTKFIVSDDLTNPERKLVVDDTLTIRCQIWICGGLKEKLGNSNEDTNSNLSLRKRMAREKVAMDIGKLLKESIGTDVTISTKIRLLKAHKAILMARSSVFAAMFNVNMLEKQLNVVQIIDFDDDVVKGMLEHVYTGETKLMAERAQELLKIAEKYDMTGLKEDCEYQLADNLNMKNAAAILVLAHVHNAPFLKQKTIHFINMNKEELLKSPTFRETMKSQTDISLCMDILFSQQ
ncbi:unnamed protein product [Orchesella dallaii]|uniref:Protein roadkill n=1 Tax=Orchesella dallaii TaxID=48710 RepID=A0ABP1R0C8_9HEXA